MRRIPKALLLTYISIMVVITIILTWYILSEKKHITKHILLDDKVTITNNLEIKLNKLVPSSVKEYRIILEATKKRTYEIDLNFEKISNSILSKYLIVEIQYLDNCYQYSLEELMDHQEEIKWQIQFQKHQKIAIDFRYYLPIDVGNEIQGTSVDFIVNFFARGM